MLQQDELLDIESNLLILEIIPPFSRSSFESRVELHQSFPSPWFEVKVPYLKKLDALEVVGGTQLFFLFDPHLLAVILIKLSLMMVSLLKLDWRF